MTRNRVPVSRCAAQIDAPVVRVDDLPHDRQAEAGSLWLGREERIEDPVAQVRRHARAVVGDVDDDRRRRRLASARERRILLDRLERPP